MKKFKLSCLRTWIEEAEVMAENKEDAIKKAKEKGFNPINRTGWNYELDESLNVEEIKEYTEEQAQKTLSDFMELIRSDNGCEMNVSIDTRQEIAFWAVSYSDDIFEILNHAINLDDK